MSKQPTLREEIKDILFFQSEPMSSSMLADWQVEQATNEILDLLLSKLPECYKRESNSDYELGLEVGTNDTIDEITKTIEGL